MGCWCVVLEIVVFVLEAHDLGIGLEMLGHLPEYLTGTRVGVSLASCAPLPIRDWLVPYSGSPETSY